jgi:hypothetical protein
MMLLTKTKFNAIPLEELVSRERLNELQTDIDMNMPARIYMAGSRYETMRYMYARVKEDLTKELRDELYDMYAKPIRLAALHASDRIRRANQNEYDSDTDSDTEPEPYKHKPTVVIDACCHCHRTRSSTKKRTRKQRNLQI